MELMYQEHTDICENVRAMCTGEYGYDKYLRGVQFGEKTNQRIITHPKWSSNIWGQDYKIDTTNKISDFKRGDVIYFIWDDGKANGACMGIAL